MSDNMSDKAIFLMGPTAVGKTELALRLADHFPLEIISVDSALIYRGLDIGSAKPSMVEQAAVPHHLIDILSPVDNYSVADFLRDCLLKIQEINRRGNLPLLVGGTMMYYNALIKGISVLPEADPELRAVLKQQFLAQGNLAMHRQLQALDPQSAAKIQANDSQRVGRALEVCMLTGRPLSAVQQEFKRPGLATASFLPLALVAANRDLLHQRINARFTKMLESGFVEEVAKLRQQYPQLNAQHNSMRCVGYRQVWDYLDGSIAFSDLLLQGKAATRQLAKRQITWLRGMPVQAVDDFELDLDRLQAKLLAEIERYVNTEIL